MPELKYCIGIRSKCRGEAVLNIKIKYININYNLHIYGNRYA